jgi:hypothetical protein
MNAQLLREIEPLEICLKQIDVKRNEPSNRRLLALQLVSAPPYGRLEKGKRSKTLPTPRMRQRFQQFIDQKLVELRVKPVSDSAFARLEALERRMKLLTLVKADGNAEALNG